MTRFERNPTDVSAACAEFDRWLEAERPDSPAQHAHAATCARCAARLAAEESISGWLAPIGARAPEGFTDRVMERVGRLEQVPRPGSWAGADALAAPDVPWWFDALLQPATVLAATAAGLLVWQFDHLAAASVSATAWLAGASAAIGALAARAVGPLAPPAAGIPGPTLVLALAAGLLPPLLLGSLAAGRWVARWTAR